MGLRTDGQSNKKVILVYIDYYCNKYISGFLRDLLLAGRSDEVALLTNKALRRRRSCQDLVNALKDDADDRERTTTSFLVLSPLSFEVTLQDGLSPGHSDLADPLAPSTASTQ
jgi:hypothetical protein